MIRSESNIGQFDVGCNGVIEDDQFDDVGHIFAVVAIALKQWVRTRVSFR